MCSECMKAILDKGLLDEYKDGQYFQHTLAAGIESHAFYKGVRLCEKWWEENVDGRK